MQVILVHEPVTRPAERRGTVIPRSRWWVLDHMEEHRRGSAQTAHAGEPGCDTEEILPPR